MEGGQEEGRGKISCLCLLNLGKGHIHKKYSRTHAHWIHTGDWIGAVAFSRPQDTAAITLFGCKSWGFVIYNQFSALVSPCTHLSCLFAVCILPQRPSQHSSVVSVQHPPPLHTLQSPVKCAPAVQAVGTVYHSTSSGSPGSNTPHVCRALTSV